VSAAAPKIVRPPTARQLVNRVIELQDQLAGITRGEWECWATESCDALETLIGHLEWTLEWNDAYEANAPLSEMVKLHKAHEGDGGEWAGRFRKHLNRLLGVAATRRILR
jgi:hypothetical protein